MTLLKTIKTNGRDLITGLILVVSIAFIADLVERLTITEAGLTWLVGVVNALQGVASFAAVNLAAWFMLSVAWPSLNLFSNDDFKKVWDDSLSQVERFWVFIVVSCVMLITAAICFS